MLSKSRCNRNVFSPASVVQSIFFASNPLRCQGILLLLIRYKSLRRGICVKQGDSVIEVRGLATFLLCLCLDLNRDSEFFANASSEPQQPEFTTFRLHGRLLFDIIANQIGLDRFLRLKYLCSCLEMRQLYFKPIALFICLPYVFWVSDLSAIWNSCARVQIFG